MNTKKPTGVDVKQLWVGAFSPTEKGIVTEASRILGLRKTEFYRRAIIEKAQSVISSTIKANEEASSVCEEQVGGASCLLEGEV